MGKVYFFDLTFGDKNHRRVFKAKTSSREFMISFVNDVIDLLSTDVEKDGKRRVKLDCKNDKSFRQKFDVFLSKHKKIYPQLFGFNTFLNNLEPDEMFFVLPNIELDIDKQLEVYSQLQSQKSDLTSDQILNELKEVSEDLFKSYSIKTFGEFRHGIGHRKKMDRVCRFCNKAMPEVSFNKKAHAISEGIGNKTLIIYDECDTCNNRFSETIEPELIDFFSLFRTIYDVKGKGGRKKIKGENFELENDNGTIHIRMYNPADRPKTKDQYKIPLIFKEKLSLQNIYRALVKIFLSLVDDDQLGYFKKTIQWVNGDISATKLPLISYSRSTSIYTDQPYFTYYLRKSKDNRFPYVICDFQFICFKYVFVIPFCDLDTSEFLKKEEKEQWWSIFKKFHEIKWIDENFSSDIPKKLSITLDSQIANLN